MKKRRIFRMFVCAGMALLLTGCTREAEEELPAKPAMTLMYLAYGEDEELDIYVDEEGGFYEGAIPEGKLEDMEGNPITKEVLESGDYIELFGNEIMVLETSPGKLVGVQLARMTGERAPQEEVEEHLDFVYKFYWSGPEPGRKPMLAVTYSTGGVSSKQGVTEASGWDWSYLDRSGETVQEEQAAPEPDPEEISQLIVPMEVEDPGYRFIFEWNQMAPARVTVSRYAEGETEDPEQLLVCEDEEAFTLSALENGAVYEVAAEWEMGNAGEGSTVYLFSVQDDEPYKKAYQRFLESTGEEDWENGSPGYNPQEWLDPADFE